MKAPTSIDEAVRPALEDGEELRGVAVGVAREPAGALVDFLLHLVGAGFLSIFRLFARRYYFVALTDRRLLFLGVKSSSDLTVIDRHDIDPSKTQVSFSETPGRLYLTVTPPGALEFEPLLLEANYHRARAIGEQLGAFESPSPPQSNEWPLDVLPFSGLRRLRTALAITVVAMVAVAGVWLFRLQGGLGASCTGDSDCRGRLFCSRKFVPSGVCTLPCQTQADCPGGHRCSSFDRSCIPDDEAR